ncbi:NnrS protein involved in response to NO [Labilithrix luteola]|uniref:NnrS protein involved in response to NO n=1 Tax=Labilithrix luteola TaxID=1391654 RepID=A0A0K1QFM0_9BACT|nr:NnrS family protein [Labilithrix luteola]AKV04576.1 NnrS protein involved in response to NO [Labilithrix luteola]
MGRSLLTNIGPAPAPTGLLPIAAKGFRPFFLLAAAFAVAIVPLWLAMLGGLLRPVTYLDPLVWHSHEMVFGFATAVIAGFLLTAVSNWTGRETATGPALLGLALLWCVGRLAPLLADSIPHGLVALLDLAFLPALAVVLARPIVASNNRRNFVMLAILAVMTTANLVVHLEALGVVGALSGRRACLVGIDVVLVLIGVISGRVIPMFTRNATGASSIRSVRRLDQATVVGLSALVILDATGREEPIVALVAGVVGLVAAARAVYWGPRHSLREPMLWILHLGYAWLPLGLVLRAGASLVPWIPRASWVHAATVGAIGSLCLGMMARVALGHTGRKIVAPRRATWAFAAMSLAAVVRVFAPVLAPSSYLAFLTAAGALWTVAFLLYLLDYMPMLIAPRVDGKAG